MISQTNEKITAKTIPDFEALSSGHRACQGCGEVLAMRMALKAIGKNTIVVSATGCMEVVTTPFPQTAWEIPWMHVAFENASAVGSGIAAARKALLRKGRVRDEDTKLVILGGDGGTYDIGFQSLSGALERGHDFVYLCFDNEAYMNTGIQRSSATPIGAWTTTSPIGSACDGKANPKKDLTAIVANHNVPYVATATPAHHLDLMNKVRRAANTPGPAFVHIFSPCPTGWRMPSSKVIDVCKLAVKTKVYPLFEVVNGKTIMGRKINKPLPVVDYLKTQGRFQHLSETQIQSIQSDVDQRYAAIIRLSEMWDIINGADILVKWSQDPNAERVFGYPGTAILPVFYSLADSIIDVMVNTNEQSCAFGVAGVSPASKKVGVAVVTSGSAVTGTLTAVVDSNVDSIPLLVFAGRYPLVS